MKQLLKLRLFSLLTKEIEDDHVANEISKAYEEFALKIFDKLRVEQNITELYYNLGFVRLEQLIGLRDNISGENKKNVLMF